jgi:hypothetical protein
VLHSAMSEASVQNRSPYTRGAVLCTLDDLHLWEAVATPKA